MKHFSLKMSTIALASIMAITTGCASKQTQTNDVVVAPSQTSGYTGKAYTGGALVTNTETIKQSASVLPSLIHFDYNSDVIKPEAAAILDVQVQFLTANETARVLVAGHTDERGSREYNMSLGERRATAVRNYLLGKGIKEANVEIVSFGEERPVATGSNEEAWSQNRRAELSY